MIFDDETTAETGDEADAETESVEVSKNETAVTEDPDVDNEATADDDGDMPLPEGGSLKMSLDVEITESGPCLRHVVVKVPRADIDAVHDVAVGELSDSAEVPGFRKGHVPAGLIAKRFRRELADEVKQKLLVGSLEQRLDGNVYHAVTV